MKLYDIIEKKKKGETLSESEIQFFVTGYTEGSIPDYQVSALLMAIYFQGMNVEETTQLTMAMAHSGELLDLSGIKGIKVDKHSTGGVGDKTTLIVAPIVAACGHPVAKMSGRGLGHTGGTIDKMESILGLETELTKDRFIEEVNKIGISVIGQSGNICPADKKIYALRDVTATVDSPALIASSVMSKKIAAGADKILLDVKIGKGAFIKTLESGIDLAKIMVGIGKLANRTTMALLSNMDAPLGHATGNQLEIEEVVEILNNKGPEDLKDIVIALAGYMLVLCGEGSFEDCTKLAKEKLENGQAYEKLLEMVKNQGGQMGPDGLIFRDSNAKPYDLVAKSAGYVSEIDAEKIGLAALALGAGREKKEDTIDYGAGIYMPIQIGTAVKVGDKIATLYTAQTDKLDHAGHLIYDSLVITPEKPKPVAHTLGLVDENGVTIW